MFDLARAFAKKQEVETARLDAHGFRLRARTIALLAARVSAEADSKHWASQVATKPDDAILAALRALLAQPVSDTAWDRMVVAAAADACDQLIAEHGDPTPHRLA